MLYPLFLNLRARRVAVFGGGRVALRKVKMLLACGARVEVVSRDYASSWKTLRRRHAKQLRIYNVGKAGAVLKKAELAFVASSDSAWNKKLAAACRRRKIWVNVADEPALCDFYAAAHLRKGDLQVAISTGGRSPLLARRLREELAAKIRPEAIRAVRRLGRLRAKINKTATPAARKKILTRNLGKGFELLK